MWRNGNRRPRDVTKFPSEDRLGAPALAKLFQIGNLRVSGLRRPIGVSDGLGDTSESSGMARTLYKAREMAF